jgi:monolysocardiolipin acyltransferase
MGAVGGLSRGFMVGFNNLEVTGLDGLLGVLDRRKNEGRGRGLLTVCNHVAVYVRTKRLYPL